MKAIGEASRREVARQRDARVAPPEDELDESTSEDANEDFAGGVPKYTPEEIPRRTEGEPSAVRKSSDSIGSTTDERVVGVGR